MVLRRHLKLTRDVIGSKNMYIDSKGKVKENVNILMDRVGGTKRTQKRPRYLMSFLFESLLARSILTLPKSLDPRMKAKHWVSFTLPSLRL